MDEIIVCIARAVASKPRLRILSALARAGEITPTALAEELHLLKSAISSHLKVLSAAGMIRRRRSGAWCYCQAKSPYTQKTISGKIASWLFKALADPEQALATSGVHELRKCSSPKAEEMLHKTIFEALTAFTNVRRLQLLRLLRSEGAVSNLEICKTLSMSFPAASRHLEKLIRRGYLTREISNQHRTYRLAKKFKTSIHASFFGIVRREWDKATARRS